MQCSPGSNIIFSQVRYKVRLNDDSSLKLKTRIALHGNEDSEREQLRADCCMCYPIGIRLVITMSTFKKWHIIRTDVKTAFLQTGPANRSVYVIALKESRQKNVLWLLLTAAFGLVNSNAKWKVQSDHFLAPLGLIQSTAIRRLFIHLHSNGVADMFVIKIVDDILATRTDEAFQAFVTSFEANTN